MKRYTIETDILPIEIRPGYFVRIQGIPYDLSEREASKIIAIIRALASVRPGDAGETK